MRKNNNIIKPVRTAIAGCGGVTKDVLEVIAHYPELEIVAVQDINPDAASATAGAFGIPKHYTDFEELLAPHIELVVINTPNHLHHPQAMQALRAGKHCLVQKPIARTSNEAKEMIEAAKSAGKLLGVTMEELGNIVYRRMKDMIQAGCIGHPVAIQSVLAHTHHLRNSLKKQDWRASPELIGGGSFIQLAIHHLNLSQWMLDDDIIEVGARSVSVHNKNIFPEDETTVAWARFNKGALGSFTSSFAFDSDAFFIHGTDGYIGHRGNTLSWKINHPYECDAWSCEKASEPGHIKLDWYNHRPTRIKPEYEQHRHFALAIRGGGGFEVPGEIGLRDLRIVEAVYKSARDGMAVRV
jgi:predicted dehydrogenase